LIGPAYERGLRRLLEAGDAFPYRSRSAYGGWLAQTYHYVVHTTRLIALAASRFDERCDVLHRAMLRNLDEERDHDRLLLDDLAALGYSIGAFPEQPLTSAFYQVVYHRIEHQTPFALFGYSLLLEGAAAERGGQRAREVTEAFGASAASFLRVHGDADPGHVERGFAAVERVSESEARVIAATINQTATIGVAMLGAILEDAGSPCAE
jgi:pyrroloquinoline quinone (PQQ) biosynthesis protein C